MTDRETHETLTVGAPLTQVATGVAVSTDTTSRCCEHCGVPLESGTPVIVQLARTSAQTGWTIHTLRCRDCPRPPVKTTQSSHQLAGTLSLCSHAHTQTHTLCLVDVEPRADRTPTASQ